MLDALRARSAWSELAEQMEAYGEGFIGLSCVDNDDQTTSREVMVVSLDALESGRPDPASAARIAAALHRIVDHTGMGSVPYDIEMRYRALFGA